MARVLNGIVPALNKLRNEADQDLTKLPVNRFEVMTKLVSDDSRLNEDGKVPVTIKKPSLNDTTHNCDNYQTNNYRTYKNW
jgi:hypothetical protein